MTPVFLDSSFLIALVLSDDQDHELALKWQAVLRAPLLTTEYVIAEVLDGLSSEHLRKAAITTIRLLRSNPAVQIIPASTGLLDEGIRRFEQRLDKEWGVTDCISFIIMEKHAIHEALTADHHFEQAGFIALLRHSPPKS